MGKQGYQFNTFSGVFLPSILSILGVVMFMRLGSNIAKFGTGGALGILFFAETIAVATGLSISAISTNTAVRGGGPYFLISRSLGPGFGSSIGITYYASQSLAVPFYIIGFSEAFLNTFPNCGWSALWVGLVPLTILAAIAIVGADWAVRAQYFIMAVLGISIVVILVGAVAGPDAGPTAAQFNANLEAAEGQRIDILTLATGFAVFFPAVTGFLAGSNMSGDLADPQKSIPRGTLAAIGVGLAIYLVEILLFSAVWDRSLLTEETYYKTLYDHAIFHLNFLVFAGVAAATLSSALGTLIGAPRILQAFAADKIFRPLNFFAKGSGRGNDPIIAMILTLAITVGVVLWSARSGGPGGSALNAVAELVTMVTLFTYAIINIAAAVESFAANPSFRPRFRAFHWLVGAYGALACFAVALFINAGLLVIAFAVVGALFFLARRQSLKQTFGDARRGYYFEHIRRALVRLAGMPTDAKNWRPQLLILSGGEPRHLPLVRYGALLNNGRGILSVARFITESDDGRGTERRRRDTLVGMERFMPPDDEACFPTVVTIPDMTAFDSALNIFLQSRSLGPLTPNIVLTGWPSHTDRVAAFCRHLLVIRQLKMNSLVLLNPTADDTPETPVSGGTVDIWWRGRRNGSLMLILAYLVTCNRLWRKTPIRLLRVAANGDRSAARSALRNLVKDARIGAECVIVNDDRPFSEVFRETSAHAALIFLGFVPPEEAEFQTFYDRMSALTAGMPTTFLASSAGDTDVDS